MQSKQSEVYAPIAIFAFNRPGHLSNLFTSLLTNPEAEFSEIYLFIDGPRTNDEKKLTSETKKIGLDFSKFLNLNIFQNVLIAAASQYMKKVIFYLVVGWILSGCILVVPDGPRYYDSYYYSSPVIVPTYYPRYRSMIRYEKYWNNSSISVRLY